MPLPGGRRFLPLEEVVRDAFGSLYPGMEADTPRVFRVTRSAELHLEREQVEDLLHAVEEQVRKRRFRPVVRLEVEEGMPEGMRAMLLRELQYEVPGRVAALGDGDVYPVPALVDLRGRARAGGPAPRSSCTTRPRRPPGSPWRARRSVFDALRAGEVLVSFPGGLVRGDGGAAGGGGRGGPRRAGHQAGPVPDERQVGDRGGALPGGGAAASRSWRWWS